MPSDVGKPALSTLLHARNTPLWGDLPEGGNGCIPDLWGAVMEQIPQTRLRLVSVRPEFADAANSLFAYEIFRVLKCLDQRRYHQSRLGADLAQDPGCRPADIGIGTFEATNYCRDRLLGFPSEMSKRPQR